VLSAAKAGTMRAATTARKVEERIVFGVDREASKCGDGMDEDEIGAVVQSNRNTIEKSECWVEVRNKGRKR